MRYLTAREEIRTGDILTCAGRGPISKVIQWWTGSEISHVGMAIWVYMPGIRSNRLCILEAHAHKGVRLAPLSEVLQHDYWQSGGKVYWQPLIGVDGVDAAANAMRRWNKLYANWFQFVAIAFRFVGFVKDTDPNRDHCSELVTRALMQAGYPHDKNPSLTTPEDVSHFSCLGSKVLLEPCSDFHAASTSNPTVC